jgi:hypothetical protein
MALINLDQISMKVGFDLAEKINAEFNKDASKTETLLTKALGVLQEQGIYAFLLFCMSRSSSEKSGSEQMYAITEKLLKNELKFISADEKDLFDALRKEHGLASPENFDKLILTLQVLEKGLIYARYHAKALKKG